MSIYTTSNAEIGTFNLMITASVNGMQVDQSIVFSLTVHPLLVVTPPTVFDAFYLIGQGLMSHALGGTYTWTPDNGETWTFEILQQVSTYPLVPVHVPHLQKDLFLYKSYLFFL